MSSPFGHSYHIGEDVESGNFAFTAAEDGAYTSCFWAVNHQPPVKITIDFVWRTGIAAKDWSQVAKKGQVDVSSFYHIVRYFWFGCDCLVQLCVWYEFVQSFLKFFFNEYTPVSETYSYPTFLYIHRMYMWDDLILRAELHTLVCDTHTLSYMNYKLNYILVWKYFDMSCLLYYSNSVTMDKRNRKFDCVMFINFEHVLPCRRWSSNWRSCTTPSHTFMKRCIISGRGMK